MKWNNTGRGLKALGVSLAVGLGMTACSRDYTVGYLYVTNAKASLVTAYAIDFQSGSLGQLADSPIPSGGTNPVTLAASPNGKFLYVLNRDTSSVVEFTIGTDGKIYAQNTYSVVQGNGLTGTLPTAASIDPSGNFLCVTFTYQNGFTPVKPGPGGIAIFPIKPDGSLSPALTNTTVGTTAANPLPYIPVGNNPTAIVVSPNASLTSDQRGSIAQLNYIYVIDQERPATGSPFGVMLAFSATTPKGSTTPAIAPVAGPLNGGFPAGTTPSAITVEPRGSYIYVTDSATNQLYGYAISAGGSPLALLSSPFSTGLFPVSVAADPRGMFVYVANFTSSTVSTYAVNQATGALSGTGGAAGVATGPTCVTIDPAVGIYLYTSNNTDGSISAEQLDPHTGALRQVQGTQFSSQGLPTCAVTVANGDHATQIVQ
jgi:6-phosphogluconolactonase